MTSSDIQALKYSEGWTFEKLDRHLIMTQIHPVLYCLISKCGSTLMRNVFWFLDHGKALPTNRKIVRIAKVDQAVKRDMNLHRRPQVMRTGQVRDYGFSTLHLEGLNWQLPQVIGG